MKRRAQAVVVVLLSIILVGCRQSSALPTPATPVAASTPSPSKPQSAFRSPEVEKMLDKFARFYRQMETGMKDFDGATQALYDEAHEVLDPIEPKTEDEKIWKEDFLDYVDIFEKYDSLRKIANAADETRAELHRDYSFKSTEELFAGTRKKKALYLELRGMWEKL